MAEVLIKAEPGGAYAPGDIIAICPDGHPWTKNENLAAWIAATGSAAGWPANLFVAKVPEMALDGAEAAALIQPYLAAPDENGDRATPSPCLYAVDLAALAVTPHYETARTTGSVTLTLAEALAFVVNKSTGGAYP